ncbi:MULTISPECIES: GNAT family N-acetyltransferase [Rufibacter]|uniref:GNAT superfamily N-acetyltransferase n=1 Tax=Rufibacter quisquiliarum TaxID=1549639 RepID=A0A839GSC8_9BACT|nr:MULTISPECIES: GNAT family N-acetyltransferase [Rufibacter]MBA9077328.1 GNAT superfamily N-acetyltransferase [Rufibacter quisquiliarum]
MNYKLNPDYNTIDWKKMDDIFAKVGWSVRQPEDIRASFEKSSYSVFIYDEAGEVVAFGRTVDDGKYYAQLADIVVDPDYQGEGVGSFIVETLVDQLQGYHFITLTAAPGKSDFYEAIGWKKQTSAYIWPLTDKQKRQHTEEN